MSKTVGILSMQRVINYGSFLQAYALKQLLLKNGVDEVYFIDIKSGRQLSGFETRRDVLKLVKNTLRIILSGGLFSKLKDKRFYSKLRENSERDISLLKLDRTPPKMLDVVMIGSDEVFNCCQRTTWGYTLQLYGDIQDAYKVISYAGSFGHTTYEQLLKFDIDKEIGRQLKTLSAISVRDQNSYDIVNKVTGIKPEIHLDPVLVYGYQEELKGRTIHYPKRYMIVYSYQGRIADKKEIQEIMLFAKSNNLKLLSLYCRYDWCDEDIIPDSPFDVLAWFKGAEYVVTDTFHGTIFAVITRRRFCTLVRENNGEKINYLLEQLSLKERIVVKESISQLNSILISNINYIVVEELLQQERYKALEYIKEQL